MCMNTVERGITERVISNCTVSQVALKALDTDLLVHASGGNESNQQEVASGNKLNLFWIPGHGG